MTIFDLVTSEAIEAFWYESIEGQPPYLGEELFPNRKQRGIELKWIVGRKGLPLVLKPSAFDVKVIPRPREGFGTKQTEMPFFKESKYIHEELRQELILVLNSNSQALIDSIMDRIFDDTAELLNSAAITRERMRWLLLTSGTIAFSGNGQQIGLDYGLDAGQLRTATTAWSNPAADIYADIKAARDYQSQTNGTNLTRIVMNQTTFNYLLNNEGIKNNVILSSILTNPVGIIDDAVVTNYFTQKLKLSLVVYDKQYIDEQGVQQKYVPDDVVVLLPDVTIGYTVFGTTPEEADLMGLPNIANVSIVDTGVAVTTTKHPDPVNVETKVSQIVLPSGERIEQICIIDTAP